MDSVGFEEWVYLGDEVEGLGGKGDGVIGWEGRGGGGWDLIDMSILKGCLQHGYTHY